MKRFLEIQTPIALDITDFIAALLRLNSFSAIVLDENGGIDPIFLANLSRERIAKEIFLKISCRDRNRIALHSRLLTAACVGFTNLVLSDGAHPILTAFPSAKPVYEMDSLSLLLALKNSFSDDTPSSLASVKWTVGAYIGGVTSADIARARKLLRAGVDTFFVRSVETVRKLRRETDKPIILSVTEECAPDMAVTVREAEDAGAAGVNLVVTNLDRVLNGTIAF
jgi:5,10-methylenetetrahydrofolate reductase